MASPSGDTIIVNIGKLCYVNFRIVRQLSMSPSSTVLSSPFGKNDDNRLLAHGDFAKCLNFLKMPSRRFRKLTRTVSPEDDTVQNVHPIESIIRYFECLF